MASDEEGTQLSALNTSWRNLGTNVSSKIRKINFISRIGDKQIFV